MRNIVDGKLMDGLPDIVARLYEYLFIKIIYPTHHNSLLKSAWKSPEGLYYEIIKEIIKTGI